MNAPEQKPPTLQENLVVLIKVIGFTVICTICVSLSLMTASHVPTEQKVIQKIDQKEYVRPKTPQLPPFCLANPQLGRPCMILDQYGQVLEVGILVCDQDKTDLVCQTTFPLATPKRLTPVKTTGSLLIVSFFC